VQKAPLDPGKPALDGAASLLMTFISVVSRSLQVFTHPFRISENTEATSILVNYVCPALVSCPKASWPGTTRCDAIELSCPTKQGGPI